MCAYFLNRFSCTYVDFGKGLVMSSLIQLFIFNYFENNKHVVISGHPYGRIAAFSCLACGIHEVNFFHVVVSLQHPRGQLAVSTDPRSIHGAARSIHVISSQQPWGHFTASTWSAHSIHVVSSSHHMVRLRHSNDQFIASTCSARSFHMVGIHLVSPHQ